MAKCHLISFTLLFFVWLLLIIQSSNTSPLCSSALNCFAILASIQQFIQRDVCRTLPASSFLPGHSFPMKHRLMPLTQKIKTQPGGKCRPHVRAAGIGAETAPWAVGQSSPALTGAWRTSSCCKLRRV